MKKFIDVTVTREGFELAAKELDPVKMSRTQCCVVARALQKTFNDPTIDCGYTSYRDGLELKNSLELVRAFDAATCVKAKSLKEFESLSFPYTFQAEVVDENN